MFALSSRYYNFETAKYQRSDGTYITYIRRRFVPPADQFQLLVEHTVSESERLDQIAAQYLGDPEQFWRVADANEAVQPDDLTQTLGRILRITLPAGIPGMRNA